MRHTVPQPPAGSESRHVSPWTRSEKVKRLLWQWTAATVFRHSPHPAYRWRAWLLHLFGAKLGPHVKVRRTARVEIPWNLTAGEHTAVGDHAILYCLGPVTLGRYVTISQYAHLCAGTHDTHDRAMTLLRPPITVGDDAWIAADAFVGPGVTVGARSILGARSSAFSDLPPDAICVGSPAQPIKPRQFTAG